VDSGYKPTDHIHTTGAKISGTVNTCKQGQEIVKVKFRHTRGKAPFILKFNAR
jgi:hypothetical protein